MILVLVDRYGSPFFIDTKNVPVALHLTSKWRFTDVIVIKNSILQIFTENRSLWKTRAKGQSSGVNRRGGGGQSAPYRLLTGKFLLTYREKRGKEKRVEN